MLREFELTNEISKRENSDINFHKSGNTFAEGAKWANDEILKQIKAEIENYLMPISPIPGEAEILIKKTCRDIMQIIGC